MVRGTCRKFTLADILILVASTAAGLAAARSIERVNQIRQWYYHYPMMAGSPMLAASTLGLFLCRLRSPRPRLTRLLRQPGAASCAASMPMVAVWAVFSLLVSLTDKDGALRMLGYVSIAAGSSVVGAWLILWITRTVRRESGWIDRSGLVLGWAWIALMIVTLMEAFLS